MSLARLKTLTFSTASELCNFVNTNNISVIEQIVVKDGLYQIFYRE